METLDKHFKETFENSSNVAPFSWTEQKGWQAYRLKYGKLRTLRNTKYMIAAAASIAVIIASYFGFSYFRHNTHTTLQFSEIQLANQQYFAFKNGANYKYKIAPNGQIDTLMVEGECYIESANNPVAILLKNSTVIGHNATFSVRALPGEQNITVTVLKGQVSVWHSKIVGCKLNVFANEQCVYYKEGYFVSKEALRDSNFLAWYTGRLVFEGAPMSVVAKKLSEYYNVPIGFADSTMMYCRISSVFEKQSFDNVMRSIANDYKLEISNKNKHVMLSGGYCK